MSDLLPELLLGRDGLLLRRWTVDDAEMLAEAVSESLEHLRPWMPWVEHEPLSLSDRRTMIAQREREWLDGGDVQFGVFLSGRMVGCSGLHRRLAPDGLEIGYWIHPGFTRRGLATAAAGLATKAALAVDGITHVEIHHDKANVASAGVPLKLGFRFLGERFDGPGAPGESGIEWRWRMDRDASRSE